MDLPCIYAVTRQECVWILSVSGEYQVKICAVRVLGFVVEKEVIPTHFSSLIQLRTLIQSVSNRILEHFQSTLILRTNSYPSSPRLFEVWLLQSFKPPMVEHHGHRKAFYLSFTYSIPSSSKSGRSEGKTSMTDSHIKYNDNTTLESLVKLGLPMFREDDSQ